MVGGNGFFKNIRSNVQFDLTVLYSEWMFSLNREPSYVHHANPTACDVLESASPHMKHLSDLRMLGLSLAIYRLAKVTWMIVHALWHKH